jgi:hypothetical protein
MPNSPRLVDSPMLEPGRAGRWIALAGAVVGGLVLALVLIPDDAVWTHGAFLYLHGHR